MKSQRRTTYEPSAPPEAYIVPLLAEQVRRQLDNIVVRKDGSARVLDVGCGEQPFRADLERRGYRYSGMDLEGGNVRPDYIGRIDMDLPVALAQSQPFDLILCTEVLEHVPDWETAFRNLARLMAPGGHLVVTCPHFYLLHEEPWDYWRPTPHALRHFGEKNNLRVDVLEKAGDVWDVLGTLISIGQITSRDQSFSSKLQARAADMVLGGIRKLLLRRSLARSCSWSTPFYLSNVAVFTKSSP